MQKNHILVRSIMFIDIHAHAYREGCPPADGVTTFATPDEVLKRYDEIGIEKGVLLPLIGPEVYLPQSNEDILDMCANSGGQLIPFCNIDPRAMTNSSDRATGSMVAPLSRPWLQGNRRGYAQFTIRGSTLPEPF